MTSKNIDVLNIGLLFISLVLAFRLPFELFLFSYAVLGPLHYLTEIHWLKEKNYFVQDHRWMWFFVIFAMVSTIPVLSLLPSLSGIYTIPSVHSFSNGINYVYNEIILAALLLGIGLVFFKKSLHIILFWSGGMAIGVLAFNYVPDAILAIGVFVPTLIHVYLFTLLFMIFGTVKNKSTAGIVAIVFMILCPVFIFMSSGTAAQYQNSHNAISTFTQSNLHGINYMAARFFGKLPDGKFILLSDIGIRIQVFIAFSYTYHYLNWFTKTSIIGWHKDLSKKRLAIILAVWALSVLLYWYDFKTGLIILFFLSLLHVFLELPLNVTSMRSLWISKKR